jgi:hypothetical protein
MPCKKISLYSALNKERINTPHWQIWEFFNVEENGTYLYDLKGLESNHLKHVRLFSDVAKAD